MLKPKLGLYLLLIFCTAILFFIKQGAEAASVSITDDGFYPSRLEIEPGTRVVFKNRGQKPHWPASNFHPSHEFYPESGGCIGSKLDACRPLATNETFEFVFSKVGEWPMHDHLSPGLIMVIAVGQKNKPKNSGNLPPPEELRVENYADQMRVIKDHVKTDPVQTWQYLKEAFVVDGQVLGNAHEFAHIIGNEIYSKHGLSGIKYCDDTFAFGCYHGVSEKLLETAGKGAVKATQEECLKIFPPEDYNYTGCIHGMGHGLLTWRGLDVKLALNDCDQLDAAYRAYCYDGVFMENALVSPKQAAVETDLWKLCKDIPSEYQYNCARYQAQAIRALYEDDLNRVAQACLAAPILQMQEPCLESVGYYVAQTSKGETAKIKQMCGEVQNSEAYNVCITAAARETIFQQYNDWERISLELCNILKDIVRDACLTSNEKVRKQYNR
jgi:plastocyanin